MIHLSDTISMPENSAECVVLFAYHPETDEYVRPLESSLKECGGILVESSNWNSDGSQKTTGISFSPTELWEFADGSVLRVSHSGCEVMAEILD